MTTLTVRDLWDDPVVVAELLQLWDDVCGAAGGGQGPDSQKDTMNFILQLL